MIGLDEVKLKAKRRNDENNRKLHFIGSLFSIYFSWIFINCRLSPNSVTGIFFLTGLCSVILFSYSDLLFIVIAYILWRLHIIFDICDGEVARFTKKFSINGAYWDYMIHAILYPAVYASICYSLSKKFNDDSFLILALFGSIILSQTLSVKNNYYRAMLFDNQKIDNSPKKSKPNSLRYRLLNLFIGLISIEGFLLFYVILSATTFLKEVYFISIILFTISFLLQVIVKFILFSRKITPIKRN